MIKLSSELRQFSADIGYEFQNPGLLITALTHSSLSSVNRSDNERLEFLGDRVLGLVMAQALLDLDAKATEGQLANHTNTFGTWSLNESVSPVLGWLIPVTWPVMSHHYA